MQTLNTSIGRWLAVLALAGQVLSANQVLARETITIAGTEAYYPMLLELANAFNSQHSGVQIKVPQPVGSRGGLKALLGGKADLASVSRPINDKEKSKGLVYVPFAESQVVFVANANVNGVDKLTKAQILEIYSGRITNWRSLGGPDHEIFPITRDGGSTLKALARSFPEFKTVERPRAKHSVNSEESVRLVAKYGYSLAYVPLGLVGNSGLKVIEVVGLSANGSALWTSKARVPLMYGLVYRFAESAATKAVFEFLASAQAQQIMGRNGARPIKRLERQ